MEMDIVNQWSYCRFQGFQNFHVPINVSSHSIEVHTMYLTMSKILLQTIHRVLTKVGYIWLLQLNSYKFVTCFPSWCNTSLSY